METQLVVVMTLQEIDKHFVELMVVGELLEAYTVDDDSGSESRPPMLNKENYVPWSSRLLWYAKSRPNGKLIHNSIINGPYVRGMIPEPGDTNREVPVNETFHVQTDDELTEKELKQIEADDQAIQTILLGLPEDIYVEEKKAKLFNEWERFTSNDGESIESYYHRILKLMNDLKRNKHFPEKIATGYTQLYDFLKYNQNEMVGGNGENQFRQYAGQNVGNLNGYNDVENVRNQIVHNAIQNLRVRNVGNHNGLIGVPGNANQNLNRNGNLVAVRAEGNAAGHNGNQIRCYNYRGQASTSSTQTDKAPVYDSDGSAKVHTYKNCDDNEIFNMFTQEKQYIEQLEPIPETHQVPQNDNNVISKVTSVEQIEVEKVNTVN
nr:hypothetical protein [Tanacetum cinerariifolium]